MTIADITLHRLKLPLATPYHVSYRVSEDFEPIIVEAMEAMTPSVPATVLPLRIPVQDVYKFDSRRCYQVDLDRWMSGAYAVPAVEPDEEDVDRLVDMAEGNGDPETGGDAE